MAHKVRLLRTGFRDCAFNMGLDEAVLESVSAGIAMPTLRLYAWRPAAVSIGFFQGLEEEVDVEACRSRGIGVVRRITGGGAVFHQDELTYSVILPETHPLAPASILKSYGTLCSGVISGLDELGIEAEFAPINDIVATGRKVSGNAQTRKSHCLLQHGTVLLSVDVDLMFDLLKVPSEKAKGKLIADVKARVTGASDLVGREISFAEAETAMILGFAKALEMEFSEEAPTAAEIARAEEIARAKFADPVWTARR